MSVSIGTLGPPMSAAARSGLYRLIPAHTGLYRLVRGRLDRSGAGQGADHPVLIGPGPGGGPITYSLGVVLGSPSPESGPGRDLIPGIRWPTAMGDARGVACGGMTSTGQTAWAAT